MLHASTFVSYHELDFVHTQSNAVNAMQVCRYVARALLQAVVLDSAAYDVTLCRLCKE